MAFPTTANARATFMPLAPPKASPTRISTRVSAVSKNAVRKTFMELSPVKSRSALALRLPYLVRFQRRQPVAFRHVQTQVARSAWHPCCRRGPPRCDRRVTPCLRESAAPADPESVAEWCAAVGERHKPDRNPLTEAACTPPE